MKELALGFATVLSKGKYSFESQVTIKSRIYDNLLMDTRVLKQIEKRLRRLQRRVSRKCLKNIEGSKFTKTSNIIKIEKQIKLIHRKLANIRINPIHQATNLIVKTKP